MNYGTDMAAVKISEINSRISTRLAEISASTGVSFSDVFSGALDSITSTTAQSSASSASSIAAAQSSGGNSDAALIAAMLASGGMSSLSGGTDSLGSSSITDSLSQMLSAYNLQQKLNGIGSSAGTQSTTSGANYENIITSLSAQYGMNANLVRAVARAESGFDADAVSASGAIGIMQLMPSTVESLGITNPYDPAQNIEGGIRTLLGHIMRYDGDIKMALAAYNCGTGTLGSLKITDLNDQIQYERLPAETRAFLTKISAYTAEYGSPGIIDENFFG